MILQANALHLPIASNSVQCCVTSPPYWGLRDYGNNGQLGLEKTPEEYVARMVQVFREVWRVLKPDGTLWLNLGDSYAGSPVGSFNGGGSILKGRNTSGIETSGTLDKLKNSGLKPKDLVGIPWRVAFALQADGWYLRSDIIWHKPNPMPESVTDRPTKSHEYLFLLAKQERYFYNAEAIREPLQESSIERSNYGWNGRMVFDEQGRETYRSQPDPVDKMGERWSPSAGRNARSVWTIATQPYSGAHFATFPEKLVEPCILAGSRPGDVVFDPFCGSGTVMRVARRLQRKGVGCDINPAYLSQQADKRIRNVQVEFIFTGV